MKDPAIKENHLYVKAYRRGERYVGRYVAVYVLRDLAAKRIALENPKKESVNRVGLSVGKKIGGAVQRNRAKRIIRAAYADHKADLKKGYLIVISAREAINGQKSGAISAELKTAFAKVGLLPLNNKEAN
jgi:ribonuclease P protein component